MAVKHLTLERESRGVWTHPGVEECFPLRRGGWRRFLGAVEGGDRKGRMWSICSEPEASGASDRDGLDVGIAGRDVG